MSATMNLWPIGNCQVSALIDGDGTFVWGCVPRVDGDPAFSALLDRDDAETGFWRIELEGAVATTQRYLRNTPILVTRHEDAAGNAVEVTDFCPRFFRDGRAYRPTAFVRVVRPVAGSPRIRAVLRVATDWGHPTSITGASNHIRYLMRDQTLRLTTDAPVDRLRSETFFRVERPLHLFLGPDESFGGKLDETVESMLERTIEEWRHWVRGLATPVEWQDVVIRSAITLKLCQHEPTGAIVAALTTSLPEHADSGRNWDYRYCWVRDAYYTVQALNRLGALDVLETYLEYLRNIVDDARGGVIQPLYGVGGEAVLTERIEDQLHIVDDARGGVIQPLYGVGGEAVLTERIEDQLPGYRGMGPVRVGNQAYEQVQHDAYGQIVLSYVQAFFDRRLLRMASIEDFRTLEAVGERAWAVYDKPDAGLWELRTKAHVHTYSAAMCWAACDRLAKAAEKLELPDRHAFWAERATTMRARIEQAAWREDGRFMSATFDGDDLDASLIQLLDLRFLAPDDPRFLGTLSTVETGLRRGSTMLRYATEDDFGRPHTAFNVCTFWLIEALHATGRGDDARQLFEEMVARCTPAGLLSEDIDPATGELWGNYPQTYSLVGLINCAVLLSKPWNRVR